LQNARFTVNLITMIKDEISKAQLMTKGQMEAEVSNALIAFEKEHMGRGPVDVRTHINQDMVLADPLEGRIDPGRASSGQG
jgi:hypothetical protein